ncbi:MAG TPA: hypothetical protein DCR44_00405 [Acholeplasmatales bacterium]|nr:MAG: hypothetical protein A2Y16_05990 [Tenericutes bacterium GWF2_57_13]HAQ55863.1 hypothetical protein [Acholeplasmatales bacterium]
MPRPRKLRTVCCLPENDSFGPRNESFTDANTVRMSVDEYETIRLIDLEGLTQEECAVQMNVARTTVQSIYSEARKKIADVLVNRKWLQITGGDVVLCDGGNVFCGQRNCKREHCSRRLGNHPETDK